MVENFDVVLSSFFRMDFRSHAFKGEGGGLLQRRDDECKTRLSIYGRRWVGGKCRCVLCERGVA